MSNIITFGPEGDEDKPLGLGDLVSNADPRRGYTPPSGSSTPPPENQPCRPRVRPLPDPAAEDPDPLVWVNLTGRPVALASGSQHGNGRIVVNENGQKSADEIRWDRWKDHEVRVVVLDADDHDEDALAIPAEVSAAMEHNLDLTIHLGAGGYGLEGEWTGTLRAWPEGGTLFRLRTAAEARERRALVAKRTATAAHAHHAAEQAKRSGAVSPGLRSVGQSSGVTVAALIPHHLVTNSHAELIAPETTGKTGVAVDLALSIATGTPWAGQSVTRGRVVYMVGEGGGEAFDARVDAWLTWHGLGRDAIDGWFVVADPSAPIGGSDWATLAADVAAVRPALVVIDTRTAHLLPGADENATSVATAALGALAELRRNCGGATTLVLHHPGAKGTTGRGNTSWSNAADTRFLATRKGDQITLTEDKQRHFAGRGRWVFTSKEVSVDHAVFDTASVVVHEAAQETADDEKAAERAARRQERAAEAATAELDKARNTLVEIVTQATTAGVPLSGAKLDAAAVKAGIPRDRARELRKAMSDDGTFTVSTGARGAELYEVAE